MSKDIDWDRFVPTKEIREYEWRHRESIRQREQIKLKLEELEKNQERYILGCGICHDINRCNVFRCLCRILALQGRE